MSAPIAFAPPLSLSPLSRRHGTPVPPLRVSRAATPSATLADSFFQYRQPFRPHHHPQLNFPHPAYSRNAPARAIQLVASDLDGTLLNQAKSVDSGNVHAIVSLIQSGVLFVPATGKSRVGAIRAMGPLGVFMQRCSGGAPNFPGVYLNGLLVCGSGGRVIFERGLKPQHARVILKEAEDRGLTVLFYSGDRVVVRQRTMHTDMFIVSHEPVPEPVRDLETLLDHTFVHKALLVDPRGSVRDWRDDLQVALAGVGVITQARPDVLEVLPSGGSKGDGFQRLLHHLGVANECAMAIGDGENDLEMIRAAGLGVAVANSVPELILAADEVVCANHQSAVAYAIRKFVHGDD